MDYKETKNNCVYILQRLNRLNTSPMPTKSDKIAERQSSIQKQDNLLDETTILIAQYQAINENDRNAVFEVLDKWKLRAT